MTTPLERKAHLRAEALLRRHENYDLDKTALANAIQNLFLRHLDLAAQTTIAGYWPLNSEANVIPLMTALHEKNHIVGLPITKKMKTPLGFRRWQPGMNLEPDCYNIPSPPASSEEIIPDIILVPLVAADRRGYRLGYGQGNYDATLAHFRAQKPIIACGIAYEFQMIDEVPFESHDEKLDMIITEKSFLDFRSEKGNKPA